MKLTRLSMMETSLEILKEKAKKIKWVFTDVDGTLTDGCVYYSPQGELLKKFSLRDGTGFFLLREAGIKIGIITGENSPIVEQRAKKLQVDKLILGGVPKVEKLKEFLESEGLTFENVAYIGDDLNDIKLLRNCELGFAVGDADTRVKDTADIVLEKYGGSGAFREAAELLLSLIDVNVNSIIETKL